MKTVSIVIPVYNAERYIEKCLMSVSDQTYSKLEILVIDDGSSDRSWAILKKIAEVDSRIRLFHQENAGVSAARNKGIEEAAGEYLTFVDGDDYLGRDYIQALVQCAEEKNAEMVICGLTKVKESGEELEKIVPGEYIRFEKEEWPMRISCVACHLYKRELWEKYQIRFGLGVRGEDMPISLFFSAMCDKIATLPEAGYFYVQHSSSAMHNFQGLRNYKLPYQAIEDMVKKVQELGVRNSSEFFELFVLRILATCLFELGRGASQKNMNELCDFIRYMLNTYFPHYYKNPKICLWSKEEIPLVQRMAVYVLVILNRVGLLGVVSRLISR